MKVSGFSIIRNAQKFGYPVVEAISSILPLCDEFVVNVGKSDDETLDVVKSICSSKMKIIEREWDLSLRTGGRLISEESNRALDLCHGDWCLPDEHLDRDNSLGHWRGRAAPCDRIVRVRRLACRSCYCTAVAPQSAEVQGWAVVVAVGPDVHRQQS